jgi:hypothetical protein
MDAGIEAASGTLAVGAALVAARWATNDDMNDGQRERAGGRTIGHVHLFATSQGRVKERKTVYLISRDSRRT